MTEINALKLLWCKHNNMRGTNKQLSRIRLNRENLVLILTKRGYDVDKYLRQVQAAIE